MELTLGLSLLIGLLLGLLGGGGSILTVPMLVYVMHTEPKTAILTSFVVVGISSLIAIVQHARKGHVCWRSGIIFGVSGMIGAFAGGRIAGHFPSEILMALFGLVTLATAVAMLRRRRTKESEKQGRNAGKFICPLRLDLARLLFDGFFVGALTGMVGVGGGFLIVPALTLLVGLSMPAAVGTSLLIIMMNAVAGLAGYINHASLDLNLTMIVTGGAIAGSLIGGWMSLRIRSNRLRQGFGSFVLMIAVYVLAQSITPDLLEILQLALARHFEFMLGVAVAAAVIAFGGLAIRIHRTEIKSGFRCNEEDSQKARS
jgi:uncharacterized protein